ncbi:MAG: polyphenol oxidase family protein [Bdellovibrionales bacterium]|jgi:YfiH family protein|nr:polyphenol oxidase family protein [Bdellovibrionales bacterium]
MMFKLTDAGYAFNQEPLAGGTELTRGFGNRALSLAQLQSLTPSIRWTELKQTHSDIVIQQPSNNIDAESGFVIGDAHFTFERGHGLVIKTADCIPLLISGTAHGRAVIGAVHAGWRGVVSNISGKTIHALQAAFPEISPSHMDLTVWIGPHIRQKNFEVGSDVAPILRTCAAQAYDGKFPEELETLCTDGSGKSLFDLEKIVRRQLIQAGIQESSIHTLDIDTKADHAWASYRRDGANAGRNLSFIGLS